MGNDIIVPYSGHIPGGVRLGTDVVISGRVLPHAHRFSFNLCVGPNLDQDCALHFNPRFDSGYVVRNHRQGGAWGAEETVGGNPFHKNMGFEVHIKVNQHGYKITVNNRHFCNFPHRLPKESVHYIYIEGGVSINFIQFRGGTSHPVPAFPGQPSYPPAPAYPSQPSYPPAPTYPTGPSYPPGPAPPAMPSYPGSAGPIYNPPVPLTTPIPGGLYPGKIVYISGIPNARPSRFTVNMLCGPYDTGDIGLHFDARFNYGSDRNQVIRNHRQGGSFGSEERHISYFPFSPNVNFEMMILVEPGSFKVAVNNQHFIEFYHRIQPMQRLDHLNIVGDVRLTQIRFQ